MPVAFLRENGTAGFAPVARPRFLLGRDLDCDLVDTSPDVAEHHATVRYRRGEFLLKAEEEHSLWVNGERIPFLTLRDGDAVRLAPEAEPWTFRSRVEGTFWPPEIQVGEAWLSQPRFAHPENGPRRFGDGPPIGGRDPYRCRLALGARGPWVVKHLAPIEDPLEANEHLRLLAAIGGARHASLAPLVDGGIAPHRGKPWRWLATRYVGGIVADRHVEEPDLPVERVLEILAGLADGLRILHHRGLVHRFVAPENVVVAPEAGAVLIDYGHTWSAEHEVTQPTDMEGASGHAAPEVAGGQAEALAPAVDVYGWAATGFALLTGTPPRRNLRPQGVLERVRAEHPERWVAPDEVIDGLVAVLVRGLAADPAMRPTALACAEALRETLGRVAEPAR